MAVCRRLRSISAFILLLLGAATATPTTTREVPAPSNPRSTPQDLEGTTLGTTLPRSSPPANRSLRTTLTRIHFAVGPDYEDYDPDTDYEDPSIAAPTHGPATPCDYDRCRHLQVPCEELQLLSRCLCPGISGSHVRPDPPRLGEVQVSEGAVTLHWCAPSSTVDQYRIELQLEDPLKVLQAATVNATHRLATFEGLQPGTDYVVCVVALNRAGASEVGRTEWGPCRTVQTPSNQLRYLYVALGLGAAALLILGASGLTWYCHGRRRKSLLHGPSAPDPVGVPNMSYRSESVEQL